MERLDLFATPVFVIDLPDTDALNRELVALLLDDERHASGLQRSNFGGWHSKMDLMERPQTCFRTLTDSILSQVGMVVTGLTPTPAGPPASTLRMVHAWAMIMRDGDYTILHDHGDATWSIVYYADAGDTERDAPSGGLVFMDPRQGVRRIPECDLFAATVTFQPRDGAMVVFPGWLKHQVCTYRGLRPRISISANIVMHVPSPHEPITC